MSYHSLQVAAQAVAAATGRDRHRLALVLGSGMGDYAASLPSAVQVPYAEVPGFPQPKVAGHSGSLFSAAIEGNGVLALAGRAHYYEGWSLDEVVFGVRVAILSGCHTVVLTNAAGAIGEDLEPGDLVLIRDHLNLTGRNPLIGPNDERLGPRFFDLSDLYRQRLRSLARRVGEEVGVPLKEGVYAWFSGPSYETPAEIEMVRRMGGELAGMSTVPEAIAAAHMGASVLGISLVTNLAAGISPTPLSHDEVQETAARVRDRTARLLDALLPRLL
ncbi:MAG: purine-nucleoside phosphorylase [Actinomycetota bacterium]|nr:purine-nucleoside phosphorylase [Actinomycetota bacterium]